MLKSQKRFFHMHLVSDATGETLNSVAKAAAAYYADYQLIEHIYALVRSENLLKKVLDDIVRYPGMVLFTISDDNLKSILKFYCKNEKIPCISILDPVIISLEKYLSVKSKPNIGGQHTLDANYFKRIDALNFAINHDDGLHSDSLEDADVVLVGISRSSKTPTCIYLANRGVKAANFPIVLDLPIPDSLDQLTRPVVVGLISSAERIAQIRRHRLLSLNESIETTYTDRNHINKELMKLRELCAKNGWPILDVTRRSIEETAAAVLNLLGKRDNPEFS